MAAVSKVATEPEKARETPSAALPIRTPILLIGFSVLYFTDTCIRASEKYFWFDEIYTVFQSRLSLHGLWGALRAGFDFNPPLVYLLTQLSNFLFGDGLIATRLPEIIGFWIFSVSLFYFVSKRAGLLAGFSAMVLPMFTGAFYYGYEARPPGLVLGFCGVALLAWQMSLELRRRSVWLNVFSIALFAAFMTHCYAITLAVPFGVAELFNDARSRRIEYRRWAALVAPVLVAGIAYVPLLHAYRNTEPGTIWLGFNPVALFQIGAFYQFLLAPCVLIILLILTLLVARVNGFGFSRIMDGARIEIVQLEMVLGIGFLILPISGLLLALAMHSPFYDRYFVSALTGVCILAGFGIGAGQRGNWASMVLAAAMACSLINDVSLVLWRRAHGSAEFLLEPSSGFSGNSSLHGPLADYGMLVSAAKKGERIVVMWPIEFLYLVNYAPELRSQLYYIGWDDHDVFYRILDRVHPYAPFPFHTMEASEFYADRSDFMFFGEPTSAWQLHGIGGDTILKSFQISNGHFLAEVSIKPPN